VKDLPASAKSIRVRRARSIKTFGVAGRKQKALEIWGQGAETKAAQAIKGHIANGKWPPTRSTTSPLVPNFSVNSICGWKKSTSAMHLYNTGHAAA